MRLGSATQATCRPVPGRRKAWTGGIRRRGKEGISMTTLHPPRGRGGRLMLLVASVTVAVIAVQLSAATSSADNGTLTGNFCTANNNICMTMTWNGIAYGTTNRSVLSLKPGAYTLTVNDTSAAHDFALRSCPGSTAPCDPTNPLRTTTPITTQAQVATVSTSVNLTSGTYRLYCAVPTHETRGMFVDFQA